MKRILKAIFASVLAMALTLPALSGCGSNSPKDELGEAEGEQIVITPSEETENGGALCMSVSEALEGQAGLETRQVRAQTTPANIPVDWELLWLSVQHSAGAVTDYLSYTFAATIITDGVKWSNRINLTLLERFEGTAMLRVSLKSDPTILDYVTIKAELPKASIEENVNLTADSETTVSLKKLAITASAILSAELISPKSYFTKTVNTETEMTLLAENGEEISMYLSGEPAYTFGVTHEDYRLVFQVRLTRTDISELKIKAVKTSTNARVKISCASGGTKTDPAVAVDISVASNRVLDFSEGEVKSYYLNNKQLRNIAFTFQNLPKTGHITIEVYYSVVAPYTGTVAVQPIIRYQQTVGSTSIFNASNTTRTNMPLKGSFAITIDHDSNIALYNYVMQFGAADSSYTHTSGTTFAYLTFFYYEGGYDPRRIPSEYAV